jgi:uncharacterized protein (DUF1015 family)
MVDVSPLQGFVAAAQYAMEVASLPYDVLTDAQAKKMANPRSFLHVTKAQIDLESDASAAEVHQQAAKALRTMLAERLLLRSKSKAYYLYRLQCDGAEQTGVVLGASIKDYQTGLICKHELTRPDKEQERAEHIAATKSYTGKVYLLHRPHHRLAALIKDAQAAAPLFSFTAEDKVSHSLWSIEDAERIDAISQVFAHMPRLYIADGHHRAAAAAKVGRSSHFLAVSFPTDAVRIFPYHRLVTAALPADFLGAVAARWRRAGNNPHQLSGNEVGIYLQNHWHVFDAGPAPYGSDTAEQLMVHRLQTEVLAPMLGILDPRRDTRLEFVGGEQGVTPLAQAVDTGQATAAFAMPATQIEQLLAVADAAGVMPPKSTWFAPKLRDGLVAWSFADP